MASNQAASVTCADALVSGVITKSPMLELWNLSQRDYELQFEGGEALSPQDLLGKVFLGEILKVNFSVFGSRILIANVGWLKDLLRLRLPDRNRFFEMRFSGDSQSGINYWPARGEILPFRFFQNTEHDSIIVDYDLSENLPFIQRPYLDEIRRLKGGNGFIGKFYYRVAGRPLLFLWFSLVEIEHAKP